VLKGEACCPPPPSPPDAVIDGPQVQPVSLSASRWFAFTFPTHRPAYCCDDRHSEDKDQKELKIADSFKCFFWPSVNHPRHRTNALPFFF